MLSFIAVKVCGRFEWKQICAGFFFISEIPLEIQLWRGGCWDVIHLYVEMFSFMFNDLGWDMIVCSADIDGIVEDYHCLNFHFNNEHNLCTQMSVKRPLASKNYLFSSRHN
jgi:hypothetical protein